MYEGDAELMARIADSRGRQDENSGYARLFGNQELGSLISRVQATVIRAGNELEAILEDRTPAHLKSDLGSAISGQRDLAGLGSIRVVFQARLPATSTEAGGRADIIVISHQERLVSVVELKDGDTFDTKKASGELASMTRLARRIGEAIDYQHRIFFCSFNQDDKDAIVRGAKGRFSIDNVMTGSELCGILQIDYAGLRAERASEQPANLQYLVDSLLDIHEVREAIVRRLSQESKEMLW
jgi:hypothetical protein